jgi:putative DNA primase/helicase
VRQVKRSREAIDRILGRLEAVKPSGNGYTALCPAHADHRSSLSVSDTTDGRVLLHSHAGCDTQDVLAALGLQFSDLFPHNQGGKQ